MRVCTSMHKLQGNLGNSKEPFTMFYETGSRNGPELPSLEEASWWVSPRDSPVSTSPEQRLQTRATMFSNVQRVLGLQPVFMPAQQTLYRQSCIPSLKTYNDLTLSQTERFNMMSERLQVCKDKWNGKRNCVSAAHRKPLTQSFPGGNTDQL